MNNEEPTMTNRQPRTVGVRMFRQRWIGRRFFIAAPFIGSRGVA